MLQAYKNTCECDYVEDVRYFLLDIRTFTNARDITIKSLPSIAVNIETLLLGNPNLSLPFNYYVFCTVFLSLFPSLSPSLSRT